MTTDARTEHASNPAAQTSRSYTGVIILLVVAAFVVILNETIMGVAMPHLMVDLSITASIAQWLTTAYLLTMAVIIPTTGFLLQRIQVRTLFLSAMSLFSAGTLIGALSPGFDLLLVGRVVQASGTAVMMPLLMTTILTIVPANHRGRMMGVVSIVISVAPAVGPTVSGLVLASLDWRWLFWTVLPVALITLLLGAFFVRNVTETRKVKVDVPSVLLSAVAFGGIVYGLSSIGESTAGHSSVPLWVPLTVGGVTLAAFIGRQLLLQRSDRALLDLRTFTYRRFTVAVVLIVVVMVTLFGALILLPLYLQNVLGVDTLTTGLILLPGGVLMGVLAPTVGALYDKVGARVLVIPATIGLTAVLAWMTTLDAASPIAVVVAMHVTLSACLAFMFTPLFTTALSTLPPSLYSYGSAIMGTVQQVAGAIGTALFITAMTVVAAASSDAGATQLDADAHGFHVAMIIGTVVAAVSILVALFLPRHERSAGSPPPAPVMH